MTDSASTQRDKPGGGASRAEAVPVGPVAPTAVLASVVVSPFMAPGGEGALTLGRFLTDGSLSRLFDELSALVGVRVELRDERGRLVEPHDTPPGWRVRQTDEPPAGSALEPLDVAGTVVGYAVIHPGEPHIEEAARSRLRSAVRYLMAGAADLCEQEVELLGRLREMKVLHRLSSMLVRAEGVDRTLKAALESALEVLDLDAGSVMLFPEELTGPVSNQVETELELKVAIGLSEGWVRDPRPLSKDRVFDRQALAGEVVRVRDLRGDPRVNIPELVESEGLVAALHAGMVFQGHAIGVMRLYGHRPRLFTDADARLAQLLANQAATAVEQARLLKAKRHEEQLQQQVRLGAAVQRRMLPAKVPALPRFDVAFRYVPSLDLGGDFLDVFEMGDEAAGTSGGALGVVVGDVVGKGLPAALLMSACRASLRAHVQASGQVAVVVENVNRDLCRDTLDTEFVTTWFGSLDARTARLTYCSAGHDPPLLVRTRGGAVSPANFRALPNGGLVMGIDPQQGYEAVELALEAGDVLVAYTDGLIDARSFQGERFGRGRLQQAVLNGINLAPGGPGNAAAASIVERLFWELRSFSGLKGQVDDQTVVVVRVK